MLPIGIVLEDFQAPRLTCRCGGDPLMPDHRHSLSHLKWEWAAKVVAGKAHGPHPIVPVRQDAPI
jgi:hypothetical protein